MFRRGLYVGMVLGAVSTVVAGGVALWGLTLIGGESIAEFGAKLHAFERRYQIEAQPVLGQYTQAELSEPPPEVTRAMKAARSMGQKKR